MTSPAVAAAPRELSWSPGIVAGALLGVFSAYSPGGVFILGLAVLAAWLLHRATAREHRRFIVTLFLVGFVLRTLMSLGLDAGARLAGGRWPGKHGPPQDWDLGIVYQTRQYVRMGDSDYLLQRGYATAQLARGNREPVVVYRAQQSYGWNGYAYVLGAFCYLFDFSPVAVNFVNGLLGALLGPAVFLLALAYRCEAAIARWAAVAVAGFPSLILWSATNLKEPLLHLLTACLLLFFARMQERHSFGARLGYGLLIAGGIALHATLRSAAYTWLLAGSCAAAWGAVWCLRRSPPLTLGGGLLALLLATHHVDARPLLARLFSTHLGYFFAPGICYQYLPVSFYVPIYTLEGLRANPMGWDVALWIGRAMWHYLVEPLPWRFDNLFALLAYPQMIAWYFLLPFAALGAFAAVRWNLKGTLGLLMTLAAWIALGGLTNGNIGTVFRMRDMVTPLVLLLASAGLFWCVYGRRPFAVAAHRVKQEAARHARR